MKDFDAENTALTLQESEVDRMEKWPVAEIEAKFANPEVKMTPDSSHAWLQIKDQV